jgi:hypothetical protein
VWPILECVCLLPQKGMPCCSIDSEMDQHFQLPAYVHVYVCVCVVIVDGLQHAFSVVQALADPAQTPVYLKATAGMRCLPPANASAVMSAVRAVLAASGFLWGGNNAARVISGEEEGVFGWLTVNYLTGRFAPSMRDTTVGALDMGGASTQITFAPTQEVLASYFPVIVANVLYPVYTHSYLLFGANEFANRVNSAIVEQLLPGVLQASHPCLNIGFLLWHSFQTRLSNSFDTCRIGLCYQNMGFFHSSSVLNMLSYLLLPSDVTVFVCLGTCVKSHRF